MYLARAVQLLVIGALFWMVLYVGGKVSTPDQQRIENLGQATHDAVVGVVQIGADAAASWQR